MGDREGTVLISYDDISTKTKSILRRFGGIVGTLRSDETSFSITLLDFTPYWDYKPTEAIDADSPGVYTSEKVENLCKIDKIHLKSDVIDRSVVNGLRQPVLSSFVTQKLPGYKVFSRNQTIHYEKKTFMFWKI